MPYIICVNKPGCLPDGAEPYAVATLDEARHAVQKEVGDSRAAVDSIEELELADERWDRFCDQGQAMDPGPFESVGSVVIGPMPDGHVIDVRAVTWESLYKLAGMERSHSYGSFADFDGPVEDILDVYNAQRES